MCVYDRRKLELRSILHSKRRFKREMKNLVVEQLDERLLLHWLHGLRQVIWDV